MPCRCDGFEDEPTVLKRTYDKMNKELDHVTQLLCYCCGTMQGERTDINWSRAVPPELVDWFRAHHEADKSRVMKQMLNALATMKLPFVTNCAELDLAGMFMDAAKKRHPVSKWHEEWFFEVAHEACEAHLKVKKVKEEKIGLAKRALAKLTSTERKILGLK